MARGDHVDVRALVPVDRRRPRRVMDELLDAGSRRRVCVVIGAAGWGKTTAVSSWSNGTPTVWVWRSGKDQSAEGFLRQLREAVAEHVPEPAGEAPAGIAELCERWDARLVEDLVVVIDDLHELSPDSPGAGMVEELCRRAPDRLHVFLLSRHEPPFSLERLRGQGLVSDISASELTFDLVDVSALLRSTVGEVPSDLATQLHERTGGWPAAVAAGVEALRGIEPEQRAGAIGRLCRPGERLHRYLTEEVVECEPAPARALLRRLAVFGQARSTSAIASGIEDPTGLLADLIRRGLVRRDPGDTVRWSLAQPLQDYFEHDCVLSADDRIGLHRVAAAECLTRDAHAEAMRHLVAAGDYHGCVALLRDHGDTLVNSGQIQAVLEAAELPAEFLADPRIQQVLGHARQVRGQWAAAAECFQRAGTDKDELEPALAWRVAQIALMQGDFPEVQAVYERTRFEREDTADEVQLLMLTAVARRMTHDTAGSDSVTDRAVRAARGCGEPRGWAAVHNLLALQAGAVADRHRIDAHFASAVEYAIAGNDVLQLCAIRVSHASHLLDLGEPRKALLEAHDALRLSEQCENLFLTAQSLTLRGRANARLGVLEPARIDFTTAIETFQRMGSRFLAWPLCGLGDVHRTRGQPARARAAYEEALALARPHHDVFGLSSALIGLALVRAADNLVVARKLADRAVELHEGLRQVPALLARGWIGLLAGERTGAAADAARAGAVARIRRDGPGLAEAMMLGVLASDDPATDSAWLAEAIDIWKETGCRIEEATARVVAARIGASISGLDAETAHLELREAGVTTATRKDAGPLAAAQRTVPTVVIRTLGAFQVSHDGVPVAKTAWQSKKARDLVRVLVARRRPISREQLMDLLWPDVEPGRSGNRLSVLLSTVRDVLAPQRQGDGPLAGDGNAVWLDRQQVRIDVEEFLTTATAALEANAPNRPDAAASLSAAEALHTGDFLADDPYQDWGQELAEEVRATYTSVLRALVGRLREAGDVDGVLRVSLRLLEQDGYDEPAHLDLVMILLEAGRLGEARRRYQIYARRMEEIGVHPGPMPRARRFGDQRSNANDFLSRPEAT